MMRQYAPCPKCGALGAQRMSFTWWGGLIGPRLLTHVKCPSCRFAYNGKTGRDNTTNIVIYAVVVLLISLAILALVVIAAAVLMVLLNK